MRFLVDTNLPRALCGWLRARGHECTHVLDCGLAQSADTPIWRRAATERETIVSKDEDFADRVRRTAAGPAVLWLRTGNGTNRQLFAGLDPIWSSIEARLQAGERLVEVR